MQRTGVGYRLGRGTHFGLGHDFKQRRSRPVKIDPRFAMKVLVQGFSGIFLKMGTRQIDRLLDG